MSDSEEDYMSDKLLKGCEKEDVRPGLLFNKTQKRKHELYKKQQEDRSKKPKSYHEQEKEARERGLSTAISSENKGFKMLEKMGYKTGTGLGKSTVGITEPVAIKTKDDTSGVGRNEHLKDMVQKKRDQKEMTLKAKEEEFRSARAEKHNILTLQKDYKNAQRTCEELDLKSGKTAPELPYFWSKQTLDAMKQKNKSEGEDEDEEQEEDDENDDSSAEQEDEVSEPKLCDIIMYLRRNYSYCIYCGDYVKDRSGTLVLCPGLFRRDHDE